MSKPKHDLLKSDLRVINVGLQQFVESLAEQSVEVAHVNWVPPAELEPELEQILDELL